MTTFALDTNCMIAAVSGWHDQHRAAAAELHRRFERGERLVILAPAVIEAYSVLTRLPAPHRLSPADAWTLLDTNFIHGRRPVNLRGARVASLLRDLAQQAIGGGRTYDAAIAECAREARAAVLLTFNRKDFEPSSQDLMIAEPTIG